MAETAFASNALSGASGRIAVTADAGVTWSLSSQTWADAVGSVDVHRGVLLVGLIATGANVARSVDGGATWTLVSTGLDSVRNVRWSGRIWIAVGGSFSAPAQPRAAWSEDDGLTWTVATTSAGATGTTSILSDVVWTGTAWVGVALPISGVTRPQVCTSADGKTWASITTTPTLANPPVNGPQLNTVIAEAGGVVRAWGYYIGGSPFKILSFMVTSTDHGATWSFQETATRVHRVRRVSGRFLGVADDIVESSDGITWTTMDVNPAIATGFANVSLGTQTAYTALAQSNEGSTSLLPTPLFTDNFTRPSSGYIMTTSEPYWTQHRDVWPDTDTTWQLGWSSTSGRAFRNTETAVSGVGPIANQTNVMSVQPHSRDVDYTMDVFGSDWYLWYCHGEVDGVMAGYRLDATGQLRRWHGLRSTLGSGSFVATVGTFSGAASGTRVRIRFDHLTGQHEVFYDGVSQGTVTESSPLVHYGFTRVGIGSTDGGNSASSHGQFDNASIVTARQWQGAVSTDGGTTWTELTPPQTTWGGDEDSTWILEGYPDPTYIRSPEPMIVVAPGSRVAFARPVTG